MSLDERIKNLARQVMGEASTTRPPAELAASVGDQLGQALARVDDLHTELHAVATRVRALEKLTEPKTGGTDGSAQPPPATVPRASRPRKASSE
jgi:hypothetical protein